MKICNSRITWPSRAQILWPTTAGSIKSFHRFSLVDIMNARNHFFKKKSQNMHTIGFSISHNVNTSNLHSPPQKETHVDTLLGDFFFFFFNILMPVMYSLIKTKNHNLTTRREIHPAKNFRSCDSFSRRSRRTYRKKKKKKKKATEELSHSSIAAATGPFSPCCTFNCRSDGTWLRHVDQLIAPNAPFKRVLWCAGAPHGDETADVVSR